MADGGLRSICLCGKSEEMVLVKRERNQELGNISATDVKKLQSYTTNKRVIRAARPIWIDPQKTHAISPNSGKLYCVAGRIRASNIRLLSRLIQHESDSIYVDSNHMYETSIRGASDTSFREGGIPNQHSFKTISTFKHFCHILSHFVADLARSHGWRRWKIKDFD